MSKINIRKLQDSDMDLYIKWLYKDHVVRWFTDTEDWVREVKERTKEYTWIRHYIVEVDGNSIGFCQYYDYSKSKEDYQGTIDINGTYSIDYLIGEEDYIQKGYGKQIILELINVISKENNAKRIIVKPEMDNIESCKTLESAGFKYDTKNELYIYEY